VYARHNAVDTPALLPDGSPSDLSIPGPLRAREDARPVDPDEIKRISQTSVDGGSR
jgi:NADH-quinone oxidoreductase subunit J